MFLILINDFTRRARKNVKKCSDRDRVEGLKRLLYIHENLYFIL